MRKAAGLSLLMGLFGMAAAACGGTTQDGSGGAGGALSGTGGSAGEAPTPWEEPDRPWVAPDPIPDEFKQKLSYAQLKLPDDANAAQERAYWLTGDEAIEADLIIGLGEKYTGDPTRISLVVLIDGIQQSFAVDGGPESIAFGFTLGSLEERRMHLRLRTDALEDGVHGMVIAWKRPGFPFPELSDWSIAVYKNSTEGPIPLATPESDRIHRPDFPFSGAYLGNSSQLLQGDLATPADGVLPIRFELAGYYGWDAPDTTTAVLAFLDGQQVFFSGYEMKAPAVVTGTNDHTVFQLDLPVGVERSRTRELEVWLWRDADTRAELPNGSFPAVLPSSLILTSAKLAPVR